MTCNARAAKCNPGYVYKEHSVKGYGGKIETLCGCVEADAKAGPPKPTVRSQSTDVPVKNNKVVTPTKLTSRFEGVNTKQVEAARNNKPVSAPAVKNVVTQTYEKAKDIVSDLGLPEWAIPAGIIGIVVLIIFLIR